MIKGKKRKETIKFTMKSSKPDKKQKLKENLDLKETLRCIKRAERTKQPDF